MSRSIPPSFEYEETFGRVSPPPLKRSRQSVPRALLLGGALVATSLALLIPRAVSHSDDQDNQWSPDVAEDYPYPDADYEPWCSELTDKAEQLTDQVAARIVHVFESAPDIDKQFEHSTGKEGSYGYLSIEVAVENGSYSAGMLVASDGKGGVLSETAYALHVSARDTVTNASLSAALGSPGGPRSGGPNFPIGDVSVSHTNAQGANADYYWGPDETRVQCDTTLVNATTAVHLLVAGLEQRTPVSIPDTL